MTVPAATSSIVYTADGTTAVFPYTWEIAQTADLIVYTVAVAATVAVKLALTSGYTVSGSGIATGGNVTLVAGNPAAGTRVFIASDPGLIQQLLLEQGIAMNPADIMAALDLLTRQVQAARRMANGALQIPVAESLDGYATTFPLKPGRASTFPFFDANGNLGVASGMASVPVSTALTAVVGELTLALARAAMGPWGDALVTALGTTTARDLQTRLGEVYNVKDFGAKGDRTTDDTAAIQAALNASAADKNRPVYLPVGEYKVTAPLTVKSGTPISGTLAMSSTEQVGTTLVVAHTGHGIIYDGTNGTDFQIDGGGVRDMLILKDNTFLGGDAIKVNGVSDSRRTGDLLIDNVLVSVTGTGLWDRGLNIDGSALNTGGAIGVRNSHLRKFRVAGCQIANEYIVLNQVTHLHGIQVQVDTATGTGACGITIKGTTTNVDLGIVCNGNLVIDAASTCTDVFFHGRAGAIAVNATNAVGGFIGSVQTTPLVNKSRDFVVHAPQCAAVSAHIDVNQANVTGDGTAYVVPTWVKDYDMSGEFNASTGVFTCNDAGLYRFSAVLVVNGLTSSHTACRFRVDSSRAGRDRALSCSPWDMAGANHCALAIEGEVELAFGDTVQLVLTISGGTKVVTIQTDTADNLSRIAIHKVTR